SAALWIVPGNFGFGTSDFAAIATLAPSRAARSAIASPMPREAPVMNNVLPSSVLTSAFAFGNGRVLRKDTPRRHEEHEGPRRTAFDRSGHAPVAVNPHGKEPAHDVLPVIFSS